MIEPFRGRGATPLDARFIPQLWGTLLLILSLLLTWRGLKERRAAIASGNADSGIGLLKAVEGNKEVIFLFVSLFFYAWFMESVGFLITSALFVFCAALLLSKPERRFKRRNLVTAAIVAVTASVLINYVFVVALSVRLPRGIIGF